MPFTATDRFALAANSPRCSIVLQKNDIQKKQRHQFECFLVDELMCSVIFWREIGLAARGEVSVLYDF
ncbi:MAG: hypothetical protein COA42_05945 [Alteromonadaceae bacterium]|nr:MAG: hypothetical protein COA42_05945 [Alteromonadaceae bacterium]